ncbi:MAG TPA: nickel pincer cofactor biosynthesis protein LarB [Candidatus Desulfobacillus sp.]|nr:nickel pincer cofactor biosynthesis protein LarB [Candidatus Desulfobacillus sp.]
MRAVMDWQREARTGLAEAVFAEGKSSADLAEIVAAAAADGRRLLLTRLEPQAHASLPRATARRLDYDPVSRTAVLGGLRDDLPAAVAIVSGGMSDLRVVQEARRTLQFAGVGAALFVDVGVAGLWRLMDRLDDIRQYPVVVAMAGMEGALFSVLAGLLSAPLIAVPVSAGYGVAEGGRLALDSALGSCAPGLTTVNIDNGFGAAQAALRILNLSRPTGERRGARGARHRPGPAASTRPPRGRG